jgi:signal transduction histidine kinase
VLTGVLGAVVWVVVGRVLGPVEELRRAATQVARSGGPGSLPVTRADEIGALARTLNEMLDRLEASAARQRAFVADAAHELRSPLAALRAAVDVAIAHPEAYPGAELPTALEDDLRRMQALVDDLLLLARVGSTPARHRPVDLAHLARTAVAAAQVPDGVETTLTGTGAASGDPDALVRVVRNLVDNAARHAASRVLVAVADGLVTVDDDGAGIAPADRERVFERFVRLEEARGREAGGSGLGLAIAREIARDHGGDVVLGEAPAGGLRATVRLTTA